ncbi:peptide ABC transporter substrate-binding protein [Actinomadura hibisca]|uniref:peptide ABC transporter substrate-binding protein n=1 Tax=Actinomadura hibisca TaxID=68565 RepID=UPI000AE9AFE0|nr:ABC transporter substrate-binding protein [Actinomadura hibisca]
MKSATRTAALITGAVVALVAPVAALRAWSEPADPRLSVGAARAATLLPGDLRDATGRMVAGAVWTRLVDYDPATGAPVNAAAESVTSTDRKTWTVRVKPGGRFHDGSPVTARSFAGAWAAMLEAHWAGERLLTNVAGVQDGAKGIKVTGDLSFEVRLERPFTGFPALLGDPALSPMPESVLASRDWAGYARRPIGNGPLKVASADERETVLERPGGQTVVVRTVPEAAKQYSAVEAGDLDVATQVPPNRHESMDTDFRSRHRAVPGRTMTQLAFPAWVRALADPSVRQALSMAIDRSAVTEGPLGHQSSPANALVPPGVLPGRREGQCRLCVHDERAAVAALADAGGLKDPVVLWHEPADAAWVKAVADQLRKTLKLDVRTKELPAAELAQAIRDRKVDGPYVVRTTAAYPAPAAALSPLLEAGTGYQDDYTAEQINLAETATTPEEAVTPARLAETALLRDMPVLPLWTPHDHLVWSERTSGVAADAFVGLRLNRLTSKE